MLRAMSDAAPDRHRALSLAEMSIVVIDALLGVGLCVFALNLLGEGPSGDPQGGRLSEAVALLCGPAGLLFLLAAVAAARRWPGRGWYHGLPLVWVVLAGAWL